jgi:hypothetical protein
MEAKETSARHDAPGTKAQRAIVLEYLEPQFRHKESARCALSQFIEKESNAGGLLISEDIKTFVDENGWNETDERYDQALDLLVEYVIAFERDMPPEIQNAIRKQQRRIDLIYSSMERSFLLNRLRNAVELKEFVHFNEWFHAAVDELNGQY